MGENSKIEWTDHTFNPWRGCTKVSPGCTNCYAETLSHRNPGTLGIWGDKGTRVVAAESAWREPLKWDRKAKADGVRRRVFCASLADVFEDRPELDAPRFRLLRLIASTPNLDWLLLTKRPENIEPLLKRIPSPLPGFTGWDDWCQETSQTVWLGTSVENQEWADNRLYRLRAIPAAVRFVSYEPALGPVHNGGYCRDCGSHSDVRGRCQCAMKGELHWWIAGGESGPNARPMHPDWARSIRDQCVAAGVTFVFESWGDWQLYDNRVHGLIADVEDMHINGCELIAVPDGTTESHQLVAGGISHARTPVDYFIRVGRERSGRTLDGAIHEGEDNPR